MDYDDALRWLHTLPDFERTGDFADRPDVEPVRALLRELGDPHLGRPTLHVAGSKGKGSTAVMAEAILRAAGRRTGCYISPHLHRYSERIRIDGAAVAPEAFASALTSVRETMAAVAGRFPGRNFLAFDALTGAAFVAFRDAGCDTQVVEVGLGGLLDSTNVFDRTDVVVITPISLEHTTVLGDTIPAIAAQKAGIITPGSAVIVAPQRESAVDVVCETAAARGATVIEVAKACQMTRTAATQEVQDFRLKTPRAEYRARLPLLGRHQLDNAATAVLACEELAVGAGFELTPQHVRDGLAQVSWPARLEVLKRRPLVIVDGAHNGDSARRLVAALREYFSLTQATFLFGTLTGKDAAAMAEAVAPAAELVYACSWPSPRAADPAGLAAVFRPFETPVTVMPLADAYETAVIEASGRGAVVAFGSIAFAAAVREYVLGIESDMIRLATAPRSR
ncbi:MAG: folylpolyglutamate synthase/dihydrofolate synthase family protein [Dehalococcoidia bacterium]